MAVHTCGDQRTTCRIGSLLIPCTMWVPGIGLRPSNFVARPPSLLTHPVASFSYRALLVSDYSKGFGGKYGIDKDKVDKSAVGFEYQGKTEKHESQKGTCHFLPLARPSQGDRRGHRRREERLSPAVV